MYDTFFHRFITLCTWKRIYSPSTPPPPSPFSWELVWVIYNLDCRCRQNLFPVFSVGFIRILFFIFGWGRLNVYVTQGKRLNSLIPGVLLFKTNQYDLHKMYWDNQSFKSSDCFKILSSVSKSWQIILPSTATHLMWNRQDQWTVAVNPLTLIKCTHTTCACEWICFNSI